MGQVPGQRTPSQRRPQHTPPQRTPPPCRPPPRRPSGSGGPGAAAFFDLDKTVIARSSTLAFGRGFHREGLISPAMLLKGAYAQIVLHVLGADERRMERLRLALLEVTKGWDADRVRRLVRESIEEVLDPLVYQEALELFEEHRRAGRDLYLVSSSGEEVVRPLADHLGVSRVIATQPGVDEHGRYDGTLRFYCYGPRKAVAMRAEAERRGLDLAASFAYSDSCTDVPMLEAVGNPVAVNPDRRLRAHARERGWEVRDFNRPVSLRRRLSRVPRPPGQVVAGAGAVGLAATAGWVLWQRRGSIRISPAAP